MSAPEYVIEIPSDDELEGEEDSVEFVEFQNHTQALLDNPPPPSATGGVNKKFGDFQCPICFDLPSNAAITLCGHTFCLECILLGISSSLARGQAGGRHGFGLCPLCRKKINFKEVIPLRLKIVGKKSE